jgi:hypothetical protein
MISSTDNNGVLSREEQLALWLQVKNAEKKDIRQSTPLREVDRNLR